MGANRSSVRSLGSPTAHAASLSRRSFRRHSSKIGAVCGNPARTDLWGAGQPASLPRHFSCFCGTGFSLWGAAPDRAFITGPMRAIAQIFN
jgi:hypothetical protein